MTHNIFHSDNINIEGQGIIRNAVRGVISNNSKLLLIYSPINGDYKFPGGGIEKTETHELALKREITEESGLKLQSINSIIGMITEYSIPQEKDFDYFAMQSFYYRCNLRDLKYTEQKLDKYEKELKRFMVVDNRSKQTQLKIQLHPFRIGLKTNFLIK